MFLDHKKAVGLFSCSERFLQKVTLTTGEIGKPVIYCASKLALLWSIHEVLGFVEGLCMYLSYVRHLSQWTSLLLETSNTHIERLNPFESAATVSEKDFVAVRPCEDKVRHEVLRLPEILLGKYCSPDVLSDSASAKSFRRVPNLHTHPSCYWYTRMYIYIYIKKSQAWDSPCSLESYRNSSNIKHHSSKYANRFDLLD